MVAITIKLSHEEVSAILTDLQAVVERLGPLVMQAMLEEAREAAYAGRGVDVRGEYP